MLTAKRKAKLISDSAKCFNFIVILALIFSFSSPCYALSVSGVPAWLEGAVTRSLSAVWSEIPDSPEIDREGTLTLVASRLFAGYSVRVKLVNNSPEVNFSPIKSEIIKPEIKLIVPELRDMAAKWFKDDISSMDAEIFNLVKELPQSAFTWSDEALKEAVSKIINNKLPGWEFSQQIFISENSTLINITFRPGTDMILAVKPALYSRTIPAMFRSDLEAKLLPELAPLIGIPVKWAELHKNDIERTAREFLEDKHSVENLKANVNINFSPGKISDINASVDSKKFTFQMWVAAYAGIEGKYPEAGIFFGYRPSLNWAEVYTELIFSLNDFDLTRRLGARFELLNNFWAGVEVQWPENEYFIRAQYVPVKIRRPYGWWRWSPNLKQHEAAIGYRIDEHVSIELYYNDSNNDKIGLRGMWHL